MHQQSSRLRNERGSALAYVVAIAAILAVTAAGVDLAHIAFTASEVQNSADIAALAGAKAALGNSVCGTAESAALSAATTVLGENMVDGQAASNAITGAQIEAGNYANGTFGQCGAPLNAVRASPSTTTTNLLGGLWGIIGSSHPTSTVHKIAIASFVGVGGGTPNVPLALCDCAFQSDCYTDSCEPVFTNPTWTQNAAWTGFDAGHSSNAINSFVSASCKNGGGGTPPELTAGVSTTDVTNGMGSPPYDGIRCMVCDLGMCTETSPCLVPVIDCSTCPAGPLTGDLSVVGFSEVVIDNFHCSSGQGGSSCPCGTTAQGNVDGMDFHSVFRADVPGPPGIGNFGAGFIQLVG